MSPYHNIITRTLTDLGTAEIYKPRHIEAILRMIHGTLDHLSAREFRSSIMECEQVIVVGTNGDPISGDLSLFDKLADSFGIKE